MVLLISVLYTVHKNILRNVLSSSRYVLFVKQILRYESVSL